MAEETEVQDSQEATSILNEATGGPAEPTAEEKIRAELEADYNRRLEREVMGISKRMMEENKKVVEDAIKKFREEMAPPSEQDIQKLLDQEYVEFNITVKHGKAEKHFTIKEVPISVERRMLKDIKVVLVPFASELSSLTVNILDGDAAKKIVQLMNAFDPLLDLMVKICVICLDPFEDDDEITEEWVLKNLSATRIVKIVSAQMEANKMRDFFSLLFRNTKQTIR